MSHSLPPASAGAVGSEIWPSSAEARRPASAGRQFMLRRFGPRVPKGMVYALNPALDLLVVPALASARSGRLGARLRRAAHFDVIRAGLTLAAARSRERADAARA